MTTEAPAKRRGRAETRTSVLSGATLLLAVFDHFEPQIEGTRFIASSGGPTLSSTDRLVLVVLARHTDNLGVARASLRRMAMQAGVNRSTFRRSLRRLVDLGCIIQVRRATPAFTAIWAVLHPDVWGRG